MYLSDRTRTAIWQNQVNGTILFHPPKTAGTAIKSFFREELGLGYIELEVLKLWSNRSNYYKEFHRIELEFLDVVTSGGKWCIGFDHESLSVEKLKDIPPACTLLMPYRQLSDRGKSLLKFIYIAAKYYQNVELKLTSETSMAVSYTNRHPRWDFSNSFNFLEESNPPQFIHKNLTLDQIQSYCSFMLHASEASRNLEVGNFVDIFEDSVKNNFTFTDILDDLLLENLESQTHLDRITFIDQGRIDSYFLKEFGKIPPKVNISSDELMSDDFLGHLRGDKFLKLLVDLELRESDTENIINSRLWS